MMIRSLRVLVAGIALTLLGGCQPPAQLLVEKAYIQLSPVKDNPSALYFTVRGGPEATALRAISSRSVLRVEMHETVEENGMSMMRPITTTPVPARGKVLFEPGGRHVMVWGLSDSTIKAGKATFQFTFQNGAKIETDAVINAIKPAGQPAGEATGGAEN